MVLPSGYHLLVLTQRKYGRHAQAPRLDAGERGLDFLDPLAKLRLVGPLAQFMQLPAQAVTIADHGLVKVFQKLVNRSGLVGHQVRRGLLWATAGLLQQIGIVLDGATTMLVQSYPAIWRG